MRRRFRSTKARRNSAVRCEVPSNIEKTLKQLLKYLNPSTNASVFKEYNCLRIYLSDEKGSVLHAFTTSPSQIEKDLSMSRMELLMRMCSYRKSTSSVATHCYDSKKTIVIHKNLKNHGEFNPALDLPPGYPERNNIQSIACFPLFHYHQVFGVIQFIDRITSGTTPFSVDSAPKSDDVVGDRQASCSASSSHKEKRTAASLHPDSKLILESVKSLVKDSEMKKHGEKESEVDEPLVSFTEFEIQSIERVATSMNKYLHEVDLQQKEQEKRRKREEREERRRREQKEMSDLLKKEAAGEETTTNFDDGMKLLNLMNDSLEGKYTKELPDEIKMVKEEVPNEEKKLSNYDDVDWNEFFSIHKAVESPFPPRKEKKGFVPAATVKKRQRKIEPEIKEEVKIKKKKKTRGAISSVKSRSAGFDDEMSFMERQMMMEEAERKQMSFEEMKQRRFMRLKKEKKELELKKKRCAIAIQTLVRGFIIRNCIAKEKALKIRRIVIVQALFRGKVARVVASKRSDAQLAIVRGLSKANLYRIKKSREMREGWKTVISTAFVKQERSAIVIQSVLRRRKIQLFYEESMGFKNPGRAIHFTKKLQAWYRGSIVRKVMQRVFKEFGLEIKHDRNAGYVLKHSSMATQVTISSGKGQNAVNDNAPHHYYAKKNALIGTKPIGAYLTFKKGFLSHHLINEIMDRERNKLFLTKRYGNHRIAQRSLHNPYLRRTYVEPDQNVLNHRRMTTQMLERPLRVHTKECSKLPALPSLVNLKKEGKRVKGLSFSATPTPITQDISSSKIHDDVYACVKVESRNIMGICEYNEALRRKREVDVEVSRQGILHLDLRNKLKAKLHINDDQSDQKETFNQPANSPRSPTAPSSKSKRIRAQPRTMGMSLKDKRLLKSDGNVNAEKDLLLMTCTNNIDIKQAELRDQVRCLREVSFKKAIQMHDQSEEFPVQDVKQRWKLNRIHNQRLLDSPISLRLESNLAKLKNKARQQINEKLYDL